MWLYILFLFIAFLVFILQFVLVYEDDGGLQKVWAYRLFKFFQYGFRKDLKKMYLGKDKERYDREVMTILAHVADNAQRGLSSCCIALEKDLNDEDVKIIVGMTKKAIESRFNNKFSVVVLYGYKYYDIKVEWS